VFNPLGGCVEGGGLCVASLTHCVAQLTITAGITPTWCYGQAHAHAINVNGLLPQTRVAQPGMPLVFNSLAWTLDTFYSIVCPTFALMLCQTDQA